MSRSLETLANRSDAETFEPGEPIFREGESASLVFLLLAGDVDLERDGVTVGSVAAGELFGEEALAADAARGTTARARGAARVVPIGPALLAHLAGEDPRFRWELRAARSRRSRALGVALAAILLVGGWTRPAVAATFTVTNLADSGTNSLRWAITSANANVSPPHTINFSVSGTIALAAASGPLPSLSRTTAIDASSQAVGFAPGVRLDGSALPGTPNGITFGAAADGSSVSYLAITGFPGYGIAISSDSSGDAVTHCYIGLATDGTTAAGNAGGGILAYGPNAIIGNNLLDGNVISANGGPGILLNAQAAGAGIRGNFIGTSASGTVKKGNSGYGIQGNGATGVTVGGTTFIISTGNVIAGNGAAGIALSSASTDWSILGNNIGVDASGAAAMGNSGSGIDVGSNGNFIGSTATSGANVISGNLGTGVLLGSGTTGNSIYGNRIGTNGAGTASVGGGQTIGIRVFGKDCTIGGGDAAHRNLIAGNTAGGVILESGSANCDVVGNWIGTDVTGAAPLPNGGGVSVGGAGHRVGGTTAGSRNVISGNTSNGVSLFGTFNVVRGNFIGTDASGAAALPNGSSGVRALGATYATIGGPTAAYANVISGNTGNGIALDPDTSSVLITSNLIGVNAANTAAVPNTGGIGLAGNAHTVGGVGVGNVIAGNLQGGIGVSGTGHVIKGNYIGTNAASSAAIGNGGSGVRMLVASGIVVGGTNAGEGNVISHNGYGGIVFDGTSSSCTVLGNRIGTNVAGTAALGNTGTGIGVGGTGHIIGGTAVGARNLISSNSLGGVFLMGSGHQVLGNWIGLNAAGTGALGNGGYGIRADSVHDVTIGGLTAAAGNVISGNERGVNLGYASYDNGLYNNVIGLDATATADFVDNGSGVELAGGSHDNQIGIAGSGNVIAGARYEGVIIYDAATTGNKIQGNFIGTNKALASGLGNFLVGIFVTDAIGNKIGGVGQGNVVAHNGYIGIWVESGERNEISANSIFANGLLGIDVGAQGLHENDGGDGDLGGNRSENYPLLSSVTVDGAGTQVQGLLLNEPSTLYRVEVFSSPTCDSTGFGEGKTYLGSTQVTTDASGQGTLAATIGVATGDPFVSATVIDGLGNTSEFSPCAQVGGPIAGEVQFFRETTLAYEGTLPTGDVVITRGKGLAGSISVQFNIDDDTAEAGLDYVDSDQVVTFAPWEVVKTIKVPIIVDPDPEVPDPEDAHMQLTNPTGGATIGMDEATMLIFDYDPAYPGVGIDDATIAEGDAGQKMLTFAVHMSPSDHEVTIGYMTEDGTAVQGEDYEYTEGELTFPIGTDVQYIQVPIFGDAVIEGDETFTARLTVAPSGGNWVAFDGLGAGTILEDDDPEGGSPLFIDGFEIGSPVVWSETYPN